MGADSLEISSAIVALLSNRRDLGVGIALGSNLFNLAALLGLGALVSCPANMLRGMQDIFLPTSPVEK